MNDGRTRPLRSAGRTHLNDGEKQRPKQLRPPLKGDAPKATNKLTSWIQKEGPFGEQPHFLGFLSVAWLAS